MKKLTLSFLFILFGFLSSSINARFYVSRYYEEPEYVEEIIEEPCQVVETVKYGPFYRRQIRPIIRERIVHRPYRRVMYRQVEPEEMCASLFGGLFGGLIGGAIASSMNN